MRQPTPCYLLFLPFPRICRSSFSFTNLLVYGRGYNDRLITRNRIERCLRNRLSRSYKAESNTREK